MTDSICVAFAENLKRIRKEAGLTQEGLARELSYSVKAVSKWECATSLPPTAVLIRMAEILHTTLDALLDYPCSPIYYLGIDGGATKTDFALTDGEGQVLRRAVFSSANPIDIGIDAALRILDGGIREVCHDLPMRKISVFAGISGGGAAENREKIRAFLSSYRFGKVENGSDTNSILACGLGEADGVAVIMGTGSVAFAQKDGKTERFGGLGYLYDVGGNGYSIGRDAIRAVLCAEDGTGEPTLLTSLLARESGTRISFSSIAEIYRFDKRRVASLAPAVTEAADAGDRVALDILDKNMAEIAHLLDSAAPMFKDATEAVPAVFVGGLTKRADLLFPMILKHLEHPETYALRAYRKAPVYGALLLAGMPKHAETEESLS